MQKLKFWKVEYINGEIKAFLVIDNLTSIENIDISYTLAELDSLPDNESTRSARHAIIEFSNNLLRSA